LDSAAALRKADASPYDVVKNEACREG